jgi:beta-lactamase regulating signal transducer with metallopeptidase domain
MNAVFLLPPQVWVERLGWTLLHFLWQGVLIAKLFAAARGLAGRSLSPRARYAWACAALAAMTLAPVATFALIGSGSPLIPASASEWSARPFASAGSQAAPGDWRLAVPAVSEQVLPWIVATWLCGVLAFSIRLAGGWASSSRLRSAESARPAPVEWQGKLNELIVRMRISRPVRLIVSSLAQAPAAVGWLRPAILMPVGALAGLPAEQIEALLAHELAHIRRHDYLINLLQSVAEALLFYHPSVWWISNEIRAERELCCDDVAVAVCGDVMTYASALATVESERPSRLRTAMAANGGSLVNRIRRLLDPSQPMAHAQPSPGAAVALAILLLAGIGAAAMDREPTIGVPVRRTVPPARLTLAPPTHPSAALVARHPRTSKLRTEARLLPTPEPAEEPAPVQTAQPERNIEEAAARYRFGNIEVRTWAAVDGEPVLHAIEFRGMTEEFAREVLARLPIHEGQRVSHIAREEIGDMVRDYDRRLEFGLFPDGDGGAVLRIHPPGAARAEPLRREPERK